MSECIPLLKLCVGGVGVEIADLGNKYLIR